MPSSFQDPERAIVRPRVVVQGGSLPRLLEEEVAELLAKGTRATVLLIGPPGSGRTTALLHLAATFAGDARLGLVDTDRARASGELVTIEATDHRTGDGVPWRLAPWSDDDVLDYLVHAHRDRAAAVFAAWQCEPVEHDLGRWPGICRAVLDCLASHRAEGVLPALRLVIDAIVPATHRERVIAMALHLSSSGKAPAPWAPLAAALLLRIPIVRTLLAAEHMLQLVLCGKSLPLHQLNWSQPLCEALQRDVAREPALGTRLVELCSRAKDDLLDSVLSLLCAARPGFRPPLGKLRLGARAYCAGADLHGLAVAGSLYRVNLTSADLRGADLHEVGSAAHTQLREARLDDARLDGVFFSHLDGRGLRATNTSLKQSTLRDADLDLAVFDGANLSDAVLANTRLDGASLRDANLARAHLLQVSLHGTDLRGACCDGARFIRLDLREARLEGASFVGADLSRADLSYTVLPGLRAQHASFESAWLTGAHWPMATLRGAIFADAGLAEVDWEGSDLRGCNFFRATFHLGSSRSGLVHSTTASEGSRTGFYTDESLEDRFQAPEDVRKANLRGCDLRGAAVEGCDFYLVDLRGAQLDRDQIEWLRRCRAILDAERAAE